MQKYIALVQKFTLNWLKYFNFGKVVDMGHSADGNLRRFMNVMSEFEVNLN